MDRIIVFGGTGFIGSNLIKGLLEQGKEVAMVARNPIDTYVNICPQTKARVQFIQADFNNSEQIEQILEENDIVCNLVSSSVPYTSMQSPIDEIHSQALYHAKFIEAACKKNVRKIVFTSSGGGVYGEKVELPAHEEHHILPASPHAISKATIEYYLHYFCSVYKVPYIVFRLSNPYGPGQLPKPGFGIVPTLFSDVLNNRRPTLFGLGNLIRDFIYIEDVIDAILISFDKENKHSFYNLGSGKGTKLINVWEIIKNLTQTKLEPLFVEKRSVDVEKNYLNIHRLANEYHWQPKTNLETGLEKTWEWIRKTQVISKY